MPTHPKLSLIEHFKNLPDPRVQGRCAHDLIDVLVIAVCALLCGGAGFDDMADFGQARHDWLKTFLPLRNGIPAHDTFNRVFAALKPEAFLDCFLGWTQGLRQAMAQEIVALDGKALRRALRRGQPMHYIVSVCPEGAEDVLFHAPRRRRREETLADFAATECDSSRRPRHKFFSLSAPGGQGTPDQCSGTAERSNIAWAISAAIWPHIFAV